MRGSKAEMENVSRLRFVARAFSAEPFLFSVPRAPRLSSISASPLKIIQSLTERLTL
jgi:hypothetical protein